MSTRTLTLLPGLTLAQSGVGSPLTTDEGVTLTTDEGDTLTDGTGDGATITARHLLTVNVEG